MKKDSYLFTSTHLGFRTWINSDLEQFSAMNSDPETMKYFEKPLNTEESKAMMERMNKLYEDKGYCYFAVERLETSEFLGMIGLGWKTFEAEFTPCVDIGWRIQKEFWNKGYTTEGAKRCLSYAKELGLKEVLSLASSDNKASIRVMQKIGMEYWLDFDHPDLKKSKHLNPCSLYRISF
ncbi:GNAT family N-acetyltransferase [Algoriphagus halophilus]|uniref:Protein N-acetyltransferase, RimJ/RimL family n=1 Tax=Algoriphagus halophilus TaxID=226505 RepID=A0A1N6D9S8_9BACT|nr:GNAT family N-acetyltransferase [Algoriphagus halophilus]SIN67552.1 Protein N-acetyltransferase, RimJ/RimL family [Algoriphagus halophilus]